MKLEVLILLSISELTLVNSQEFTFDSWEFARVNLRRQPYE